MSFGCQSSCGTDSETWGERDVRQHKEEEVLRAERIKRLSNLPPWSKRPLLCRLRAHYGLRGDDLYGWSIYVCYRCGLKWDSNLSYI